VIRRWSRILGLTLVVVLLCVAVTLWCRLRPPDLPAPLPQPDLSAVPEDVTRALETQLANVRRQPRSADAWGRLGKTFMANEFRNEARESFAVAEALDSREGRWPYLTGMVVLGSDLDGAAAAWERALTCPEPYPPTHYQLALVLSRLGRLDEAHRHLDFVKKSMPGHPAPQLLEARLAVAAGDWENARTILEQAIRSNPRESALLAELARVEARAGHWELAFDLEQRAGRWVGTERQLDDPWRQEVLALEPAGKAGALRAERLLAAGQLEAAVIEMEQIVRTRPNLVETRLDLAETLLRLGKTQRAIDEFDSLRRAFPDDVKTLVKFGWAEATLGHVSEARELFRQALLRKPDLSEAHFAQGFLAERDSAWPEAIDAYRRVVSLEPGSVKARMALATALEKSGDRSAARSEAQQALAMSKSNPSVRAAVEAFLQRLAVE